MGWDLQRATARVTPTNRSVGYCGFFNQWPTRRSATTGLILYCRKAHERAIPPLAQICIRCVAKQKNGVVFIIYHFCKQQIGCGNLRFLFLYKEQELLTPRKAQYFACCSLFLKPLQQIKINFRSLTSWFQCKFFSKRSRVAKEPTVLQEKLVFILVVSTFVISSYTCFGSCVVRKR